jgi:RNA polymerase sigma-70 factor (ECF subfamily)
MDGPNTRWSLLRRMSDPADREVAWREFVDLYGQPVYNFLLRRQVSRADAEVLLQDVLIKVWRSLATYSGRGPFRGWLHTVALNCVRDFWKQQPHDRASGDPDTAEQLAELPDRHWEDDWQQRLFHLACDRVRGQVQESHWRVFCEFALEGRSAREVEVETGERASYIPVIKARVQKKLDAEMQRLRTEWGD